MKHCIPPLFLALVVSTSAFLHPHTATYQSFLQHKKLQSPTSLFSETEDTPSEEPSLLGAEAISALTKDLNVVFTSEQIEQIIPHRYPFLLVDRVIEYEAGKRATAIKSVTKNEPFFEGHFPGRPIMPGVLQVEALAQLGGIIALQMEGMEPGTIFFFAGVNGVKWKKPVVPGDSLILEVEITKFNARFGIAKATGRGCVDGQVVVEVKEMTFAIAK